MKRSIFYVFIIGLLFIILPTFTQHVLAGTLGFDQSTVSVDVGKTVDVQVVVDAGSDSLNGTDAVVTFGTSALKATKVTVGTFFPTVTNDIQDGKVTIAAMVDDPATSKTGKGTITTITFQGVANGSTNLTFECANSKIVKNDINATNVIQCAQNGTSVVTVGTGVNTTPTVAVVPSAYPTPSSLPKSGIFDNVVQFAVPGTILLFIGTVARLLL